jgi:glucan phosphoethanolaminetransferase (alkaline phosphatase superfamily)
VKSLICAVRRSVVWQKGVPLSRPLFADHFRFPLVFALCALALPGICSLLLAPDLAQVLASVWVTLAAILLALLIYRYRAPRVLLHVWLLVVPIVVFYRVLYHGSITPGVLLSIQSTTVRESRELLGDHLLLSGLLAVFVMLAAWATVASWANSVTLSPRALVRVLSVVFVMGGAWAAAVYQQHGELHNLNWALKDSAREIFPLDVTLSSKIVALGAIRTARAESARRQFAFPNVRKLSGDSGGRPQIYVVVIGESSRRSQWSLYGYDRPTTPTLDRMRNQLVVFDQISSNATITMYSVALALTRANPSSWDVASREKSVITLLRQGGYELFWLSNQEKFGYSENPVTSIAREADSVSFANDYVDDLSYTGRRDPYDTNLLERLDRKLEGLMASKRQAVIFLHMMGSHEAYDQRYPPSFDFFHSESPRSGLNAKQTRVIDTYDNSVRFTDHVLASVIQRVSSLNGSTAVLYFSDHGERLFESDQPLLSGHGFPQQSRAEIEVPLVLWLSPAYRQDHPEAVAQLEANAHKPASLDNLFETVVDLTGLTYVGRESRQSFFSANFDPDRTTEVLTMPQEPICVVPGHRTDPQGATLMPVTCEHYPRIESAQRLD